MNSIFYMTLCIVCRKSDELCEKLGKSCTIRDSASFDSIRAQRNEMNDSAETKEVQRCREVIEKG